MTGDPSSTATWQQVKRRCQQRWGVVPVDEEPDWAGLAEHLRVRATRVGGEFLDVIRDLASETSVSLGEAAELLRHDASRVSDEAKSVGGKAKAGLDSAKATLEEIADRVREGISDGVADARADADVPRTIAKGVGIAAGALLNALTGPPKKR